MIEQAKEIFKKLNLTVSIEKVMHDDYDFVFFLKIFNKSSNKRQVKVNKAIYLTKGKEQLDQDSWKDGYLNDKDVLFGNAFKIAGLEFKKEKLKAVKEGDSIYTTIELPDEGSAMNISFKKNGNDWDIVEIEQSEIKIKLTPEQLASSILKKIERMEILEENLGITFENISVVCKINDDLDDIKIFLEVHPITGTTVKDSFYIKCVNYGYDGSIIAEQGNYVNHREFFGFELFEMSLYHVVHEEINKIRIYPTK